MQRPNSVDVFFMFYLLHHNKKVWKDFDSSVTLDTGKPEYANTKTKDPIELDIQNAIYLWRL